MTTIKDNLQQVQNRIALACKAAQREPDSVRLLVVSKTFPASDLRAAYAAGVRCFGENYVQEGLAKIAELQDLRPELEWHMIGPLQGNKTRPVADAFDWVHSVDRLRIAQRLSEQRPPQLAPLNICLQVNISGEASKGGVAPPETLALAQELAGLPQLRLRGLMAIPEPGLPFAGQRASFAQLRELFESVRVQLPADRAAGAPPAQFDTLSMGMSADFEAAIAEGSTMVRVGSAIFGERP